CRAGTTCLRPCRRASQPLASSGIDWRGHEFRRFRNSVSSWVFRVPGRTLVPHALRFATACWSAAITIYECLLLFRLAFKTSCTLPASIKGSLQTGTTHENGRTALG